jgi:hypothetical protein
VVADRLLGRVEVRRDLASCHLTDAHQVQDLASVRVGQCLEHQVGGVALLWLC